MVAERNKNYSAALESEIVKIEVTVAAVHVAAFPAGQRA